MFEKAKRPSGFDLDALFKKIQTETAPTLSLNMKEDHPLGGAYALHPDHLEQIHKIIRRDISAEAALVFVDFVLHTKELSMAVLVSHLQCLHEVDWKWSKYQEVLARHKPVQVHDYLVIQSRNVVISITSYERQQREYEKHSNSIKQEFLKNHLRGEQYAKWKEKCVKANTLVP